MSHGQKRFEGKDGNTLIEETTLSVYNRTRLLLSTVLLPPLAFAFHSPRLFMHQIACEKYEICFSYPLTRGL